MQWERCHGNVGILTDYTFSNELNSNHQSSYKILNKIVCSQFSNQITSLPKNYPPSFMIILILITHHGDRISVDTIYEFSQVVLND